MLYCCPYCHHEDASLYRPAQPLKSGGLCDIYKCNDCHLLYPKSRMDQIECKNYCKEVCSNIYSQKNYGEIILLPQERTGDWARRLLMPKGSELGLLSYMKQNVVPGKVLDIGAYNGSFCANIVCAGFDAYGLEIDNGAASYAQSKGLNVFEGSFPDCIPDNINNQKYSCITLKECIYYFPDLENSISCLRSMLEPRGFLLIKCHQGKSVYYDNQDNSYFSRYSDYVQGIPTVDSMKYIMGKSGFEIVDLFGSYAKSSFAPLKYSSDGFVNRTLGMIINQLYLSTESGLNKADQIVVWARKQS